MPNIVKILFSFLIMIIVSILLIFVVFYSKIDIQFIKFINSNLEIKYQNEMNSISGIIESNFLERNKNADDFIKSLKMDKFTEKDKSRNFSIDEEMKKFQEMKNLEKDMLVRIKIINFAKDTVFSTDTMEQNIKKNFVDFYSMDGIENSDNIFESSKTTGMIFDAKNGFVIFKKSVPPGVILFYYKNSLLNDNLKNSGEFIFKNIFFINDKTIFINKPENIPVEKLAGITVNHANIKTIETSISGDSNNIQKREFRFFFSKLKYFDISVCSLIDNAYFQIDRTKKIILSFLFMITLYLLILIIILFKKTEFEKAKETLSLFTAVLVEEMINANTKEEFDLIRESLGKRKKTIFDNIYFDLKKLKDNDKKDLEGQFDRVLKKVEDTFVKRYEGYGVDNMEKLEKLFEKLISTISEKGIPVNFTNQIKSLESKIISENETEEVEELEEIGEAENIDESAPAEEIQELEEMPEEVSDESKTAEEPAETAELAEEAEAELPPEKKREVSEIPEMESVDESAGNTSPEIVEIGDEDEEDLEDIFENKDNVELLKVKKTDFLEMDQIPDEILPLEEADIVEPAIEQAEEKMPENISEPEELMELEEGPGEQTEELEAEDALKTSDEHEIPRIPEEFYVNNVINDELTKEIKKIERQKTSLQILLEDIYEKIGAKLMSLLIKLQTKDSFMQTFQKGFANNFIDRVEIDGNNVIVQHIFTNERLVFISDVNKTKHLFQNIEFEKEYSSAQSLLIYPIKIFGKIRALLILAFASDVKEELETIIKILEKNKDNLRKNIMKLI